MKKFVLSFLLILTGVLGLKAEDTKPVAIFGYSAPVNTWIQRILVPNQIDYHRIDDWLSPAEYENYSVIIIPERLGLDSDERQAFDFWDEEESAEQVLEFLREGGVIVLTCVAFPNAPGAGRNLSSIEPILGFSSYPRLPSSEIVQGVRLDEFAEDPVLDAVRAYLEESPEDWVDEQEGIPTASGVGSEGLLPWIGSYSITIGGVTTAEPLAWYVSSGDVPETPAAVVHRIGDGKLYWFGGSLFRILREHYGEPFDGAYEAMLTEAMLQGNPARTGAHGPVEEWVPEPLGEPGQ